MPVGGPHREDWPALQAAAGSSSMDGSPSLARLHFRRKWLGIRTKREALFLAMLLAVGLAFFHKEHGLERTTWMGVTTLAATLIAARLKRRRANETEEEHRPVPGFREAERDRPGPRG